VTRPISGEDTYICSGKGEGGVRIAEGKTDLSQTKRDILGRRGGLEPRGRSRSASGGEEREEMRPWPKRRRLTAFLIQLRLERGKAVSMNDRGEKK